MEQLIKWAASVRGLGFIRRRLKKFIFSAISNRNGVVVFYDDPERAKVISLIKKIKNETQMLLSDNEAYQIYMAVKRTEKINGDIVEIGTYKGGSAKLICEAKGNRTFHVFDTFEGLPNLSNFDNKKQFRKGDFSASLASVKNYLKKYPNVHFYKGIFPLNTEPIKMKKFSFVHIDVDLYESTLRSLQFIYPRMERGGIIISHDYINAPGVKKAFDDFFRNKPEPIIEMSGSQCLIVKL